MSITKVFFVRELVHLRRITAAIERGLEGHTPDDPRTAGQRAILDIEIKNRMLLLDLTAHAGDPADLLMACRLRYGIARRRHERCRERQPANGGSPCDDWWETLGQMQYLCHLIHDLEELLHHYTRADVRLEIRKHARVKDFSASVERVSILRAMAQSEGNVAEKAFLIRDYVERINGGSASHR